MKQFATLLLIALSFHAGSCRGEEHARLAVNSNGADFEAHSARDSSAKRAYLETSRLAIGTILKSHHFGHGNYNETHNGIYLNFDQWSVGSYQNSGYEQSVFVTYNPRLYASRSVAVNLVTGIANGYDGWENSRHGYVPIVGVSTQWSYLKALLSFKLVAVGFELPLN